MWSARARPATRRRRAAAPACPAKPRGIGRAHRVPVHPRVRERWDGFRRDDVLGEHEPARVAAPRRDGARSGVIASRMARCTSTSGITPSPRRFIVSRRISANCGPRSGRSSASSTFAAQEVDLLADVVAPSGTHLPEHRLVLQQQRDRVGQLQLAARPGLDAVEHVEDLRGEHVTADHREVRRRSSRGRLLDDLPDLDEPVRVNGQGLDAPVRRDLLGRHLLQADHDRPYRSCSSSIDRNSDASSTMMSSASRTANDSSPTW